MDGIRLEIVEVVIFVEVFEGIVVKFFCKVIGILSLEIIWFIEGEFVEISKCISSDFDGERFLLCFSSIELDDEGEY